MRTLLLTFSLCFSVLAQGVDYGYILSGTAGNVINYRGEWYEH